MNVIEKRMNLFDVHECYVLAHCISTDCKMGAGIAVEFQKRFGLRDALLSIPAQKRVYPSVHRVGRVYNLMTKEFYYNKPTYFTIQAVLSQLKDQLDEDGITKIAIPKIGCGLDGLKWDKVKPIIEDTFMGSEIEVVVCSL